MIYIYRTLFLLLLIFNIQSIQSQELSGTYTSENSSIHFSENEEFKYIQYAHQHADIFKEGSGHYQISKNKLSLNFDLSNANRKSIYDVKTKENTSDSVSIAFEIVEKHSDRPLGGGLLVYGKTENESVHLDKEGKAFLKFPKSNKELIFRHLYVTMPTIKIPVKIDEDALIKIQIDPEEGELIENEIWNFKVKKCSDQVLILKDKTGEALKWIKKEIKSN